MKFGFHRGTTTVEFAIVGSLAIILILAVIEFGRSFFVLSVLGEATRRGARVAAVCPVNDPAIAQTTIFNVPGELFDGLDASNVTVEYLDQAGGVIGDPNGNFGDIRYVRVRIVGFQHRMIVPYTVVSFATPEFPATLPRESLGIPRQGAITPC